MRPSLSRALSAALVLLTLPAAALADAPKPAAAPAPAPGPAAPAATPAQPAPAVKGPALEVARLVLSKEDWSRAVDMLAQDAQGRMQGHPGSQLSFPPDFGAKVRGEVAKVLPYDELIGIHAKELSAQYSEQELNEVLAFYRSPTGQKFLKGMPAVSEKVSAQTQQRYEQRMPEVMQRLAAGLKHPAPPAKEKAPAKPAK